MKTMRSFTLAMLVVTLGCGIAASSFGDTPTNDNSPSGLSHFVHFEGGGTWLRDGDRITIDEIHGTSDSIAVGNLYEIKGTYRLASHSDALLAVEVTSDDPTHFPSMHTQSMAVQKGEGHFTVYLYMWGNGNPHMSFYPTDGGTSFASVYFGTGDSVLKHASWLDDPAH
jgi:hypothetical protein